MKLTHPTDTDTSVDTDTMFFDLHTHGIGRYDTRTSEPEEILKIAGLHAKAGTSAILPTIYPAPIDEMRKNMEAVRKAMEIQDARYRMNDAGCMIHDTGLNPASCIMHPASVPTSLVTRCSSLILGVHLEGPFLNPIRCGALDKKSFIEPSFSNLRRLIEGYKEIIKIITIAPEMPGALKVIERCAESGIKVNMGHSDATFRQALEAKEAGATGITHIFNAMRPFHHREPGLAGFGLLDKDVYIEVIADGVHLSIETLKLIFSVKKIDRVIVVSDSVKGAGLRKGPAYFRSGVLAGSGVPLKGAVPVLKNAGMNGAEIMKACAKNPMRYISRI